jgi:hypothetical protein
LGQLTKPIQNNVDLLRGTAGLALAVDAGTITDEMFAVRCDVVVPAVAAEPRARNRIGAGFPKVKPDCVRTSTETSLLSLPPPSFKTCRGCGATGSKSRIPATANYNGVKSCLKSVAVAVRILQFPVTR